MSEHADLTQPYPGIGYVILSHEDHRDLYDPDGYWLASLDKDSPITVQP